MLYFGLSDSLMHAGFALDEQEKELLERPQDVLQRALDLDSAHKSVPKDLKVHLFVVVNGVPITVGCGVSSAKIVSAQLVPECMMY